MIDLAVSIDAPGWSALGPGFADEDALAAALQALVEATVAAGAGPGAAIEPGAPPSCRWCSPTTTRCSG